MPASRTRTCRTCKVEKVTPEDFRDLGETGPGRPPTSCRSCRAADPALQARHAANIAKRPETSAYRAGLRSRSTAQVESAVRSLRPDGMKVCPVESGCGQVLPLNEFGSNPSSPDGLQGLCEPCLATYHDRRAA